uniref:Serine/arginine-rich splicing factor 7 n=1 Tax=Schistosoma haematobium TaxID=6185 RepID=A0A094ZN73_SCHHA
MAARYRDVGTKVYIGDLPREASERELERIFREYGRLRNVWVGARNGGGRDNGVGSRRMKPFDPTDRCYECGERGHYAYDCRRRSGGPGGPNGRSRPEGRRRSRSVSNHRSFSRSRSR